MSFYSTYKRVQQEFSTTDLQESRTYSNRFSRTKAKKNNIKQTLPYHRQKAAITIQRFWRHRMLMRKKFYQRLYEELYYHNQASLSIVKQQQRKLSGMIKEAETLQKLNKIKVEKQTSNITSYMKSLAKECVAFTFKMEKRMLSQKELNNLLVERNQVAAVVEGLKLKKSQIQGELLRKGGQREQILLRQIKQANNKLLKIVSERNNLKQKVKERAANQSQ